jgi:hypothetical protein
VSIHFTWFFDNNFPIVGSSGFIFFVEEDKNFSVGIIENNSYRKIELPAIGKTKLKAR